MQFFLGAKVHVMLDLRTVTVTVASARRPVSVTCATQISHTCIRANNDSGALPF